METIVREQQVGVKMKLKDILLDISWAKISRRYFDKSASWIYNKLNGVDGNGGPGEFSMEEKEQLKNGLYDFAERVRRAADSI